MFCPVAHWGGGPTLWAHWGGGCSGSSTGLWTIFRAILSSFFLKDNTCSQPGSSVSPFPTNGIPEVQQPSFVSSHYLLQSKMSVFLLVWNSQKTLLASQAGFKPSDGSDLRKSFCISILDICWGGWLEPWVTRLISLANCCSPTPSVLFTEHVIWMGWKFSNPLGSGWFLLNGSHFRVSFFTYILL